MISSKVGPSNQLYFYKALGYTIASELHLEELELLRLHQEPTLEPFTGHIDLWITLGPTPSAGSEPAISTPHYQLSDRYLRFEKPHLGIFYISDGRDIQLELVPQADEKTVRTYVLGTAIGMALHQRKDIALHGSVLVKPQNDKDLSLKSCVLVGSPGAGKSTLCAFLRAQGYYYMADDIAAIHFDNYGRALAFPSIPQQRFNSDSLKLLAANSSDHFMKGHSLSKACADDDKLLMQYHGDFHCEPTPVTRIFALDVSDEIEELAARKIIGIEKLKFIIENLYCHLLISQLPYSQQYIKRLETLANQVQVIAITRPKGKDTLYDLSRIIEENL